MAKAFRESSIDIRLGKCFPYWECLFVHREKGLFLSVYVDKKQNINPMWKVLNKEVDLGGPCLNTCVCAR